MDKNNRKKGKKDYLKNKNNFFSSPSPTSLVIWKIFLILAGILLTGVIGYLVYQKLNLSGFLTNLIFYAIIGLFCFFLTTTWGWIKYFFWWDLNDKLVEFTLAPIWKKAGIIEIRGGAETGKTTAIMLLAKLLKGKKWCSIPNVIPGCQKLKIAQMKQLYEGKFEVGQIGKNNVLLIDDSWDFFSKKNLKEADCQALISKICYFLSETAKTGFKIFIVAKQGVRPSPSLNILLVNKTATITCRGVRSFCRYWGKEYLYLDLNFEGHNLSIPFTEDDWELFDPTWNLNSTFAKNKMISTVDQLEADKLIKATGHRLSRMGQLEKDEEILRFLKAKFPGLATSQFWADLKKRGWKSKAMLKEELTQVEENKTNPEEEEEDEGESNESGEFEKALRKTNYKSTKLKDIIDK